jgi:ribosome-binding factor A
MESKRQQKFARVIQKELGEVFQRDGNHFLPGVMITITQIRVTSDLSIARVYLSFFKGTGPAQSLQAIQSQSREIRYKLGEKIKDQVRAIPQLNFFLDDTNEYSERMDLIFSQINKETPS